MTRKRTLIIILIAVIGGATAVYATWFHRDTSLQGSGTVEARDIRVGSKIGGRINKVLVREGDSVQPGQVLITFDDRELQASLEQSRANAEKARRGYRPEEIAEARAAAQAELDRSKADEIRTHLDFDRYDALAKKDLVSKQQRDTAEANWKVAVAQQQSAQHKLEELQRGNRREDVDLAQAAYAYDEARFRERQVTAPSAATVEVLDVRPGDLIAPNTPVA